jgi:hypothetical protein
VFRKWAVGDIKIPNSYRGDGLFIEELYKKHYRFLVIPETLAYYNRLKWREE